MYIVIFGYLEISLTGMTAQYTYYTLTAFSVRVPVVVKRTLTSLQITQLLVGASYAMAHSFVSYTVPVVNLSESSPAAAHSSTAATAEATAAFMDNIKRIIFGAASGAAAGEDLAQQLQAELTFSEKTVPCIDSNASTFAIWLNVLYLAPLTYLFVKFFITSYLRRSSAEQARARKVGSAKVDDRRRLSNVALAERAGWDAARSVEREVYGQGNGEEAVIMDDDVEEDTTRLTVHANGKANGKAKGKSPRNRSQR